jgi:N-acyl homoserine lactone hydrolase
MQFDFPNSAASLGLGSRVSSRLSFLKDCEIQPIDPGRAYDQSAYAGQFDLRSEKMASSKWLTLFCILLLGPGCGLSDHRVVPSSLGHSSSLTEMERVIDQPGPIDVETIDSADWTLPLGGLLNLNSPAAKRAHLIGHSEPVHVFVHILRHPRFGTYLVDTGVSQVLLDDLSGTGVSWLTRAALPLDQMTVRNSTAQIVSHSGGNIQGVFFTHLHVDHIMGLPDIPASAGLYIGRGESTETSFINIFARGTTTKLLQEKADLQEWPFRFDPKRKRSVIGDVVDIFGDASAFAISVPGHTRGSTAYVLRTPHGAILLTGDVSHTRWGWEHRVEPGSYTADQATNLESLLLLEALVVRHPAIDVRLGHQ